MIQMEGKPLQKTFNRDDDHPLSLEEFLALSTEDVFDLIYPQQLSISLLINGTRRWYLAEHYDEPPQDYSYFPDYLNKVLIQLGRLLNLLARLGFYRVFIPVYSWQQPERNSTAYKFLLEGIKALSYHPALLEAYEAQDYSVQYYGDINYLPFDVIDIICNAIQEEKQNPKHRVYYGIDGGNPHDYILRLSFMYGMQGGSAPTWQDIVELYYDDRTMKPLNILVAFNNVYARLGIPPLLDGQDRIYTRAITPLVMNEQAVREILYDYLYVKQDPGRSYKDIHPDELHRLKQFYAANQGTTLGLMQKYDDLTYPKKGFEVPED